MAETLTDLREGDVFRWFYREHGDDRSYGRYHCCSRIGIVTKGRLRDTYWGLCSDSRSFGPDELSKLNLTRLGNLSDFDQVREYNADYYADADVMDLNHSNATSGNFYVRKGAARSAAKMLEVANRKLERAQSDERMAARRSEELRKAIERIEAGDVNVHL